MENKTFNSNQDNKTTEKITVLDVISALLKLIEIPIIFIALFCMFGHSYGTALILYLIGGVLYGISALIDYFTKPKTDSESAEGAVSAPTAEPAFAPAPEPVPAPAAAQPESVTIFCPTCGQPMLIPSTSGSFRVTCPKCGNGFIHTN